MATTPTLAAYDTVLIQYYWVADGTSSCSFVLTQNPMHRHNLLAVYCCAVDANTPCGVPCVPCGVPCVVRSHLKQIVI